MTGNELTITALENLGVSQGSLGFASNNAFESWALRRVNRAVRRFYYWQRSAMGQERRGVTEEVHLFRAFDASVFPGGQEDVLLFTDEEKVLDVRVKYSAEGGLVLAQGFDQVTSKFSQEEWARGASEVAPRFTIVGRVLSVFPRPAVEVAGGIVVRKSEQVRILQALGEEIERVPLDTQYALMPLMEKAIYERLKNTDAAENKEEEYKGMLRDIRAQFSGRKGENIDQPDERRLYT